MSTKQKLQYNCDNATIKQNQTSKKYNMQQLILRTQKFIENQNFIGNTKNKLFDIELVFIVPQCPLFNLCQILKV